VRDAAFIRDVMRDCDTVFHLAALIGIPYSYEAPESYVDTNVRGTLNILQAALAVRPDRVVHTSTSEVYGTAQYTPIDEAHPLHPQSPYAATKVAADALVESFACAYNLPVSIVRPFNTFGPRQSTRAVVPTIAAQALAGDVVRLGTLETVRDLLFVRDTVHGFLRVAESPQTTGEVVNLGTARGTSIRDLAAMIGRLLGRDLSLVVDDRRLRPARSEVGTLIASPEKAHRLTGWIPETDLEDGLRHTLAWLEQHGPREKAAVYAR
jgi:nucleoside-diphosphate-sugar epimerase